MRQRVEQIRFGHTELTARIQPQQHRQVLARREGGLLQIAHLQKGFRRVAADTVCHGADDIHRRFVPARVDDAGVGGMKLLADGKLAGAAHFQPRGNGGHSVQQKRIGLDGIAQRNVWAENLLDGPHAGLQGVGIKDEGRRAVSSGNAL